jgi:RNA polymerase sigma-70 factor (TIGR02943 family)
MVEKQSRKGAPLPDPASWVDLYGDYLYAYTLSRTQNPSIAEDLVQETFLSALGARERFEGHSSVRTWFTGILKHKIIDHFRTKNKERPAEDIQCLVDLTDELFDHKGNWKVGPAEWSVNPTMLYERKEFRNVLSRCLSELSSRLASAFVLREMDGLTTEEICKVLDISSTNLWVILHRARMYLRRCLEINWFAV